MKLSLGNKLFLGFGVLILMIAIIGGIIVMLMNSVSDDVEQVTEVNEPISISAFEIEVAVDELGVTVFEFLETRSFDKREETKEIDAEVRDGIEVYTDLAQTEREKDLASDLARVYESYYLLGESVVSAADAQNSLVTRINANHHTMDETLEENLLGTPDPATSTPDELWLTIQMQTLLIHLDEINLWVNNYLFAPSTLAREETFENLEEARLLLTQLEGASLSVEAQQHLATISTLLTQTESDVPLAINLEDQLNRESQAFIDIDEEMDTIFEEELHVENSRALASSVNAAKSTISNAQLLVIALILTGLVVGFAAATSIGRTIVKSVEQLKMGADRFGTGQLDYRIQATTQDEIGELALAFNQMAQKQQHHIKEIELARREAVEATRMKDLFLATMSHELRTPLNAMIGFLHLVIYSGQLDDDNMHMVQRILANSQRLLNLINNILDLSRIATGGLEIVPSKVMPRFVAASVYNDMKLLAQEKGLTLELKMDENLPETILHDEDRLTQVMLNLVNNAIKFTEKGKIVLEMRHFGERLHIKVSDTGIGIPQAKQHLIFDDFFQVDPSTSRQKQGAGLGLAIVRRLVLLMDGTISLSSEVGKGSSFLVELPMNLPAYHTQSPHKEKQRLFGNKQLKSAMEV